MQTDFEVTIPASLLMAIRDWFIDNDFCEEASSNRWEN